MTDTLIFLALLFSATVEKPKPPEFIPHPAIVCEEVQENRTIYNMSEGELNSLSIKQKAKLVHTSVKSFKLMTKVVNHEAGSKMEDKIAVAAVIWNRRYCSQFPDTIRKVLGQDGQFYDVERTRDGSSSDKKAQLAILLAYRQVHTKQIPHNVLYFNAISYRTKNPKRFTKYKYYNNYFIKDSKCKCKWCSV